MPYKKSEKILGRVDGESSDVARFHQVIRLVDLQKEKFFLKPNQKSFAFLGSEIDEGVKRNLGRVGAAKGPLAIRQAMASFPLHSDVALFDCGDVFVENGDLENAQIEIGNYVAQILQAGATPILLGGGHDVTYSHYLGIKKWCQTPSGSDTKIGIINFDAHFDIRPLDEKIGTTSGTSIYHIAQDAKKNNEHFSCLALGIQKFSNTKLLFDLANQFGVEYAFGDDFSYANKENLLTKIADFIAKNDVIYLTVCMDVFAACFAPGVSAPSASGIVPDEIFKSAFDLIINSKKLIALDFAETNPDFDIDNRTSKLAASLIFRIICR